MQFSFLQLVGFTGAFLSSVAAPGIFLHRVPEHSQGTCRYFHLGTAHQALDISITMYWAPGALVLGHFNGTPRLDTV